MGIDKGLYAALKGAIGFCGALDWDCGVVSELVGFANVLQVFNNHKACNCIVVFLDGSHEASAGF